jgi:PIN domain nuclease of toxin-antitoxin system
MSGDLVLDTCAAIWTAEDRISGEAAELLNRRYRDGDAIHVSPITAWELGILFARGRLRSPVSPVEYFRRLASLPGVRLAAMPPEVLLASSFLPGSPPRDPADRIVAATAREYDYIVMTRDAELLAYGEAGHIRTIRC